ncbi:MAG: SGNH/GDSL hydrolase family protein [Pseudomonadota bacterium]
MKTVLAFGDSLTHGRVPGKDRRHAFADRWPNAMSEALGAGVHVIEEGLNGRFTAFDGPLGTCDRNGARILPTLLHSHAPLDAVVVMLGTNDIWNAEVSPRLSSVGTERLVEIVRSYPSPSDGVAPAILIVTPPCACQAKDGSVPEAVISQTTALADEQKAVAERHGCAWFDAGSVVSASPIDGVHLDAETTRALGRALAPELARLLGEDR